MAGRIKADVERSPPPPPPLLSRHNGALRKGDAPVRAAQRADTERGFVAITVETKLSARGLFIFDVH